MASAPTIIAPIANTGGTTQGSGSGRKVFVIGLMVVAGIVITIIALNLQKQIALIKQMGVKFGSAKQLNFSADSVVVDIMLNITNPTTIPITLQSIDADIYINNLKVTNVSQKIPQVLNANSTAPITVTVSFSPSMLNQGSTVSSILGLLDLKNDNIALKGTLSCSVYGIPIANYPLDIEENLGSILGVTQ